MKQASFSTSSPLVEVAFRRSFGWGGESGGEGKK